ncbi:uncharacterized protein RAG0_13734 [Rhynchosporium agropyri]|uniref:LysM domain-containing protein n=1 Tax=Rhynchosporium agropyri TaxID=914238 RepID=A0A1E1LDW9_9HELO|nr:uncharacterized protein RAG0_13734 [Rhynchosporium agropyri]
MRLSKAFLALGLVSLALTSRLYVASYSGNITTVELTEKTDGVELKATFQSQGCAPSPSWLDYYGKTSTLFCTDEGFPTPEANFTSFKVDSDGSLTFLDRVTTLNGGVNTVTYMVGKEKLMAVAHYGGSGISIVNTTDPSDLDVLKTYVFTFDTQAPAGPDAAKPAVPFIHQVVIDPTGRFLLAPDLSADQTHIFGFTEDGMLTNPVGQKPLWVVEGSGPRHLVFYQPDGKNGKTYLYLVMEKKNMLHGYEVMYTATGTMEFKNVYMDTIFGGAELPAGSAAAEIKLTPDNKYLIISSRSDKLSLAVSLNATSIADTLATFSLDPQSGVPMLLKLSSAGGLGPRSFAINNAGDRVAVALNGQNRIVILKRDVQTGIIDEQLGSLDLDIRAASGLLSSVVWAEQDIENAANISAVAEITPQSSTQGPSLLSSSSDSTTTTNITMLVTETVTISGYSATASLSLPTLTEAFAPTSTLVQGALSASSLLGKSTRSPFASASAVSGLLTFPTNSRPTTTPTGSPVSAPNSASSHSSFVGPFTDGRFPFTNPLDSTTVPLTSTIRSGSTGSIVYSISTIELRATPTPVGRSVVQKCKRFYEVKTGDTCDGISAGIQIPSKDFLEWNPSVGAECAGLIAGVWVCVGF